MSTCKIAQYAHNLLEKQSSSVFMPFKDISSPDCHETAATKLLIVYHVTADTTPHGSVYDQIHVLCLSKDEKNTQNHTLTSNF